MVWRANSVDSSSRAKFAAPIQLFEALWRCSRWQTLSRIKLLTAMSDHKAAGGLAMIQAMQICTIQDAHEDCLVLRVRRFLCGTSGRNRVIVKAPQQFLERRPLSGMHPSTLARYGTSVFPQAHLPYGNSICALADEGFRQETDMRLILRTMFALTLAVLSRESSASPLG